MRIYHNIPALTAYNALNHTSNALQKTIQKLSTGLRINSASDDAAGLAISEKMRAQISGLEMAQRNAQDGISMLQTAEGAIQSTQSILQRMRELAVQASNDTLTAEDRSYIQLEVSELKNEIDRIAHTTQFNGKRLLDGSSAGVVSSSNLSVKAYVRGSLREIDQFGQKKSFEGNYKIQIKASGAGQGEAQKSAIMVIKHANVITNVNVNNKAGAESVRVDNVPAGEYTVETIDASVTSAVTGTGLAGEALQATDAPKGYSLTGTDDISGNFTAIGNRTMTITRTDNTGTTKPPLIITLDSLYDDDGDGKGDIEGVAKEIKTQLQNSGDYANYSADVVTRNGKKVIEITTTDGDKSFALSSASSELLEDMLGTSTEIKSTHVATGGSAPTPWPAGTSNYDVDVTYPGGATDFTFSIAGNYSANAQSIVDEMNRQLDNKGVNVNDLRARVATVNGAEVVELYSANGQLTVKDNVNTAGAMAAIFGTGGITNGDTSTAKLEGGTFDNSFTFDYNTPAGLTGGGKQMKITVTKDDGNPQDYTVTLTNDVKDMNDLVEQINEQLTNSGVKAVKNDAGTGVKLISNLKFAIADGAAVVAAPGPYNVINGVEIKGGYKEILGFAAGDPTSDTTADEAMDCDTLAQLISANSPKSFTVKTDSVATAQTITLNTPLADSNALVKELNRQFTAGGLNVTASLDANGRVQLTSDEAITLGDAPGNTSTNVYDTILGTMGTSKTVTSGLGLDAVLPNTSTNIKTTFTVTTDTGTDTISLDGSSMDISSGAKLVEKLNSQLVNSGVTAALDANGFLQLTSPESITLTDPATLPAGFSGYAAIFGTGTSATSTTLGDAQSNATLTGSYGINLNTKNDPTDNLGNYLKVDVDDAFLENNASILFEVTSVNTGNKTVTLKATSNVLSTDGTVKNYVKDNIVLSMNDAAALNLGTLLGLSSTDNDADGASFTMKLNEMMFDKDVDGTNETSVFQDGAKFVYNVNKKVTTGTPRTVQISGTQDPDWPDKWGDNKKDANGKVTGAGLTDTAVKFGLDVSKTKSKDLHFRNFYVNSENGKVYEGDVVLTTGTTELNDKTTLATFTAAYIGKTATGDTKLRDLSAFWNNQGVFMLENPQTITITQGDGKTTNVTVYATDTLNDLRQKLNDAIGSGLGQSQYATGNTDKFCTFVEKKPGVDMPANGLETVAGTFIFRSLIPGAAGRLTFSGDQDIINAFALNVVNEPKESSFTASIYDAHTGAAIAANVKVTDNNLIGILHPNVDIEFDPMANIKAVWSESQSNFITTSESKPYEAVIHLVDSSTVYQVGANKGEDLALDIGDMTAGSLGITRVNVATREAAERAIGQLDAAINKVSAQRAKIGAYQNSLEYTIENLQTTATNLTAAESRIRDADMAKTMMEFVKLQILNQSGTSMLAQANQLPQQVLSLLQ